MKVFKVLVGTDVGTIDKVDAIEHDGALWLVPMWLENPAEGLRKPMRMIRLDGPLQEAAGFGGADYILSSGHIPKEILEGQRPVEPATGFVVLDLPEIVLKLPDRKLN
jgi:hypothetical protein